MNAADLIFERPPHLQAARPPERRGRGRDDVRLMVTTPQGHTHACFPDLPRFLRPGDVLVVNRSGTLPASLPAASYLGAFTLNLSTHYGGNLWLAEPRWSPEKPGPLPLAEGDCLNVAGVAARMVAPYPGLEFLWFVQAYGSLEEAMACWGSPIRYGYVADPLPLSAYQTVFATQPGSAEMPSAARPFTRSLVRTLRAGGVRFAGVVLHAGVSSLELEGGVVESQPFFPEPFDVPRSTARLVNAAHRAGNRVIAVGTTVVRALETAWDGSEVRPASGFTRLIVHPGRAIHTVDGLLTGLHDPRTSHLAMLYALAGETLIRSAYTEAIQHGYLWHEFGDSHLILMSP